MAALLGWLLASCGRGAPPQVTYDQVGVRWSSDVFGYKPLVTIDLTTVTAMPHVAPHVDVEMLCDTAGSTDQAFFMNLSNLRAGAKAHDTAQHLFHTNAFAVIPDRCDLTLSLTGGQSGAGTPPARYCVKGVTVTPGPCT